MQTFKKYLTGIGATLIVALLITTTVNAHSGDNESNSLSTGGIMGNTIDFMGGSQSDGGFWKDMGRMHNLMWQSEPLTQADFDFLAEEQKEHMGWSWIENSFENVDEYNQQIGDQIGFGRGMGMMGGGYSMWN
jgi:hypothetical protein